MPRRSYPPPHHHHLCHPHPCLRSYDILFKSAAESEAKGKGKKAVPTPDLGVPPTADVEAARTYEDDFM